MTDPVSIQRPLPAFVALLGDRGEISLYYSGEHNRCPSCGQTQWFVGRMVATCARCDAALPIVSPPTEIPDALFEIPAPKKEAA